MLTFDLLPNFYALTELVPGSKVKVTSEKAVGEGYGVLWQGAKGVIVLCVPCM
jgi:hypothetical protein